MGDLYFVFRVRLLRSLNALGGGVPHAPTKEDLAVVLALTMERTTRPVERQDLRGAVFIRVSWCLVKAAQHAAPPKHERQYSRIDRNLYATHMSTAVMQSLNNVIFAIRFRLRSSRHGGLTRVLTANHTRRCSAGAMSRMGQK